MPNIDRLRRLEGILFPGPYEGFRRLSLREYLLLAIPGAIVFSGLAALFPLSNLIAHDWRLYFSTGLRDGLEYYAPWVTYLRYLPLPVLTGLTLTGLSLALIQRRSGLAGIAAAFLSQPVWWVLSVGQIDGLILLGLTALPWLTPLVTLKPQAGYLALLRSRSYMLGGLIWLVISMAIWGPWPLEPFQYFAAAPERPYSDIGLWPWGLIPAVLMLWFSRGDMDMLMTAGTFAAPHLHPYHYFLVVPALARMPAGLSLVLAAVSWAPLLGRWLGPWAWYLGHLFPAALWILLWRKRRRGAEDQKPAVGAFN